MTIDLAVIIPALNEEHFIGKLLDSIISQTVWPKEIVVVDAFSKDRTIEEIRKRQTKLPNLRFFRIPKSTISRQRNFGAKKTSSPNLLFLDADMQLKQKDALEKYFNEVLEKKPDVASATTLPDSSDWKDIIYFKLEDLTFKLSKVIWPIIAGRNLYVKRKIFEAVGGFDEEIAITEDQELVHRILKSGGKLIFIESVKLHTSPRRLEYEGRINYIFKFCLMWFDMLFHGRKNIKTKYEFGRFNSQDF